MKKIKYVQLEPAAVLLDSDVANMSAGVFGCYWKIILHLYCNGGKVKFDSKALARLCNCRSNFEKIWKKIENKFQKRNGTIKHKRVTCELRRAKKFLQHQRDAGLASARSRQRRFNHGSAELQPSKEKESKEKTFFGKKGFSQSSEKTNETCSQMMERMIAEGTLTQ